MTEGLQMTFRRSFISLAMAGLVLGSTAAVAAPVASHARSGSRAAQSDDLAGIGTFGILLGVLIAAGLIAIIATNHNNMPASP